MRIKKKTIYWKGFRFVLSFPATYQTSLKDNLIEISDGKLTTRIELNPVKPKITGNLPVVVKTPYNYLVVFIPETN
jgi:hypothetical protein